MTAVHSAAGSQQHPDIAAASTAGVGVASGAVAAAAAADGNPHTALWDTGGAAAAVSNVAAVRYAAAADGDCQTSH